ncbi:MAG: 23S rRNA (uracil(1939)-C(5))-methyltransferase RlmD, partial [Actinobacteria bacterium]|nr:23S rRNA (uracil(1939)-C(5))-methyltransferase RlmD [Actinomycetota bacterium]
TGAQDDDASTLRLRRDDEITVDVHDLAFGGRGVARHDRLVVFVPDTAPGDRVAVRVRRARRRWAEADLVDVIRAGPDRVAPPCPYVPDCGGCRLQHVSADAVRAAKRDQVREHLARIGHLHDVDVREVDEAAEPFRYRNKMEYSAAPANGNGVTLGFHRRGRWDEVVDVRDCLLASESANAVRESVRHWAESTGIAPYDQRAQRGDLRHVIIREAAATGDVLVTVVTATGGDAIVGGLVDALRAAHPSVVGILHSVNPGLAEATQGLDTRTLWGRDWIVEHVGGVRLKLSGGSFFQTNSRMAETLYRRVVEAAALTGEEVVYDLYAGAASIGLVLAPHARAVVSIEIVAAAIDDAIQNARANGIANHTALVGDVGVVLRERRGELPVPDVAVVDPPRAGLSGRAVRRILELAPRVLVYVSCQPATFADNARRFVEGGYRLEYVQPVDMFPQTPHIEAVARFVRDEPAR